MHVSAALSADDQDPNQGPRLFISSDKDSPEHLDWNTAYEEFQKLLDEDKRSARRFQQRLKRHFEPYYFDKINLLNEADVVYQADCIHTSGT